MLVDRVKELAMVLKKVKCIMDTDPGVDDAVALALSLFDDYMDVELVTTVNGNRDVDTVTRNALHILEKFGRTDIPVARGAEKPLKREPVDASFIHQNAGMGGYTPPETTKKKAKKNAVEEMYKTIVANKNNIVIIAVGPHTNLAKLILAHPDVCGMINRIYSEGCSPYGWRKEKNWAKHISFNASEDPEALNIVLNSGIPITMVPSRIGREGANFDEADIYKMKEINDVGRFISSMYSGYWEHNYNDRRIATNDTCATLAFRFPFLFKTVKVQMKVNCDELPGMTTMKKTRKGNVDLVVKANKKWFKWYFFNAIKKLDRFKFYDSINELNDNKEVSK